MGYNNNHAGMHMIWYRRRNSYDDLEYYDRLAEENRKKKELAKKVWDMESEEKKDSMKSIEKVDAVKLQPSKKKKPENNQNMTKVEKAKKEKVIDDKYFKNTIDWYANIYLIAFERKLDIFDVICECEHLCEEDLRMQEGYRNFFDPVTILDKTIVFLNLLADKMGCDVYEFIFPNSEMRARRVYRILDKLDEKYCNSISSRCAFEYGVEGESDEDEEYVYERFSLNQYMYLDIKTNAEDIPECHMEYYFNKISAKDNSERPIYTLSVMAKDDYSLTKKNQEFNFMFGGSDIISENEGRLADFFEKLKKTYLENGGIKYDFI